MNLLKIHKLLREHVHTIMPLNYVRDINFMCELELRINLRKYYEKHLFSNCILNKYIKI